MIVRMDAIGDFVLWLDSAKELRTLYPREIYRITLLVNKVCEKLAESVLYFDEVWPTEAVKFYECLPYRMGQLFKIRRASFDIAIQPTFSRFFFLGDAVMRLSSATERIASTGDCSNMSTRQKRISDRWYTRLVHASPYPLMELERNAEFIRGLGLPNFQASVPELPIALTPPASTKPYFVIVPGAGHRYRQWNVAYFREIAKRLNEATGWQAVICGAPGEEYLGEALTVGENLFHANYVGKTTLTELALIIKDARLVVSNESGAVHIAAAVSTPSVCILGGGHYGRFLPYNVEVGLGLDKQLPRVVTHKMDCFNCNWSCINGDFKEHPMPCIEKISIDDVWGAIEKAICE